MSEITLSVDNCGLELNATLNESQQSKAREGSINVVVDRCIHGQGELHLTEGTPIPEYPQGKRIDCWRKCIYRRGGVTY